MAEISYDTVAPLITDEEQAGRSLRFAFTCPASGAVVEASASVPRQSEGAASQVASRAKRSLLNEVRWSIARSIRQALGHGAMGRIIGDLVGSVVDGAARVATDPNRVSSDEREAAAVKAFQSVARKWTWQQAEGRWITTEAAQASMSAFERQLNAAPITEPYDRSVCARMLVELSYADGRISRDEEAFLLEFLDGVATPQELAQQAPLTPAELAETSRGPTRQTLLTLAWALALCDEDLAQVERDRLTLYAQGLGLGGRAEAEVKATAQQFILGQVLDRVVQFGGGFTPRTRAQLAEAAQRLGMSEAEAQAIEAQYRKREGLY